MEGDGSDVDGSDALPVPKRMNRTKNLEFMEVIRQHPAIYTKEGRGSDAKIKSWEKVSEILGLPQPELSIRYNHVRTRLSRYLKANNMSYGPDGEEKLMGTEFESVMWLHKYILPRKETRRLAADSSTKTNADDANDSHPSDVINTLLPDIDYGESPSNKTLSSTRSIRLQGHHRTAHLRRRYKRRNQTSTLSATNGNLRSPNDLSASCVQPTMSAQRTPPSLQYPRSFSASSSLQMLAAQQGLSSVQSASVPQEESAALAHLPPHPSQSPLKVARLASSGSTDIGPPSTSPVAAALNEMLTELKGFKKERSTGWPFSFCESLIPTLQNLPEQLQLTAQIKILNAIEELKKQA